MFREYFILLLLGHVLGDFYIQTGKMADKKIKSLKWVLIHCACYFAMMVLVSLGIITWKVLLGAVIAAAFHLLIDFIKFKYIIYTKKKGKLIPVKERNIFFIDQLLHFISLAVVAYLAVKSNVALKESWIISDFLSTVGLSRNMVLSWTLAFLIIIKPANIIISKLLMVYKPNDKSNSSKTDRGTGRFIGNIERIIMLTFLLIGQFSAIGLVLTAKSIARYDKISKEPEFAEYYLLGTLLSTLLVLLASGVL